MQKDQVCALKAPALRVRVRWTHSEHRFPAPSSKGRMSETSAWSLFGGLWTHQNNSACTKKKKKKKKYQSLQNAEAGRLGSKYQLTNKLNLDTVQQKQEEKLKADFFIIQHNAIGYCYGLLTSWSAHSFGKRADKPSILGALLQNSKNSKK